MAEQKLDALIVQGANNLAAPADISAGSPACRWARPIPRPIFPKDDLMTLVSHGPMGGERDFEGHDRTGAASANS